MVGPTRKPAPKGVPVCQAWLTMRNGVMDRVLAGLSHGRDPTVVALVGRSGSGKTTAAASFVDLWRGIHSPHEGQSETQARVRSNRIQASFPDGVLWLPVGEGGGGVDRLAPLMRTLAQKLYEEVLENSVDDPSAVSGDLTSYIKTAVTKGRGGKRGLCCLVVADDVWEAAVVDRLRETGMWVLVTTRHDSVGFDEKVMVDKLPLKEADNLLRGAAGIQEGERLPDEAHTILKRCHYVAMDVAFVGRWGMVRTGRDGVAKGKQAWAAALGEIDAQLDVVRREGGNVVGMDDRDVNRLAVLRAGFMYLGREDDNAEKLYAALMVLPDGYGFSVQDAAVLLYNHKVHAEHQMKTVEDAVAILEQWAVLTKETSGLYHMHDAHMHFAKTNSEEWAGIRLKAVRRWTSHISCLKVACEMNVFTLAGLWRALKHVGGNDWHILRPYDAQLLAMNSADPSKLLAVHLVGSLYCLDDYAGIEAPMQKLIDDCVERPEVEPLVEMAAVYYVGQGLQQQGRKKEYKETTHRLSEMVDSGHQPTMPVDGCTAQLATGLSKYGLIVLSTGRSAVAERWLRKVLKYEEDKGLHTSSQAAYTLRLLGHCVRDAGRSAEAEIFYKRALEIGEANMNPDDLSISYTLDALGNCNDCAGRWGEAEAFYKRALKIKEAKMSTDGASFSDTLYALGQCVQNSGRLVEAETLYKRGLEILEAKMAPDVSSISSTLYSLGSCIHDADRPGEAEAYFKRALEILEAEKEPDDTLVVYTLHALGLCALGAGRLGETEAFLKKGLEIVEKQMDPDNLVIASMLCGLGHCILNAGRPGEAGAFFKRALQIREAEMEPDDVLTASTLYCMGCCVQQAGRPEEAYAFFKRVLETLEVKIGPDNLDVARALFSLTCYALQAGWLEEAEAVFERVLQTRVANMEPDHWSIASTLFFLGHCVQEKGRPEEAEALFKRELEIRNAEKEPDDLSMANKLFDLGYCVQKGQPGEVEAFLKRELEILEAEKGPDGVSMATTLNFGGKCTREAGRPGVVGGLFKREL